MKSLTWVWLLVYCWLNGIVTATEVSDADRLTFTPTNLKAPMLEQFAEGWESRWSKSSATKEEKGDEIFTYVGKWEVEEPSVYPGIRGDKGLVLKSPAAHHAISAKFDAPIDNTDKTLVVQYEVKLQKGLDCGGAYLKLLTDTEDLHQEEFRDKTQYQIMFGPDKCGATNKVHFIFRHKNPVSGEYEEKHLVSPPPPKISKLSTLYTLIVSPDQSFEIRINGEEVKKGSLFKDFDPPVNPPQEIDDITDQKPADWVEEAQINDPEARRPADWDEDAPLEIVDSEATKPDDWLEDEPTYVSDPDAEKPDTWDDEEDGDWIAPKVPNPMCDAAAGCGPWKPPMIRNPAFTGLWKPPKIDNPKYKGVWKPRKVKNPKYFEATSPSNFEPLGAVGFELWTMTSEILFDNIYVGHSVADAEALQRETFDIKFPIERGLEEKAMPLANENPEGASNFRANPVGYLKTELSRFIRIAKVDPIGAFRFMPEIGTGVVAILITLVAVLTSFFTMAGKASLGPQNKSAATQRDASTEDDEIKNGTAQQEDIIAVDGSGSEDKPLRRSPRKSD